MCGPQDKVLLKMTPSAVIWSTILRLGWTGRRIKTLTVLVDNHFT